MAATSGFFRGQLGGDEHLLRGQSGVPDRAAHAFFIAVSAGRVDMAVARLQRARYRVVARLSLRNLPGTEAEAGNLYPACQDHSVV